MNSVKIVFDRLPVVGYCQVDVETLDRDACNSVQGHHVSKRSVEHNLAAITGEQFLLDKAMNWLGLRH